MYCRICGKEIPDDSNFCPNCGTEIKANTEVLDDTKESEHNVEKSVPKKANKNVGCSTILVIVGFFLLSLLFKPFIKQCSRQQIRKTQETTGVFGAGADRAERIIDGIKKEMPIKLEVLGTLNRVYYGTGLVVMDFEPDNILVPKEIGDNNIIVNANASKQFVIAEIQNMPDNLKCLIKEVADEEFSLSLDFRIRPMGHNINVILGPSEIIAALTKPSEKDKETMELLLRIKAEKMFLPFKMDSLISMVDIGLDQYAMTYIYEVDDSNFDITSIDEKMFRRQIAQELLVTNFDKGSTVNLCVTSGRNIGYKFIGTCSKKEWLTFINPTSAIEKVKPFNR